MSRTNTQSTRNVTDEIWTEGVLSTGEARENFYKTEVIPLIERAAGRYASKKGIPNTPELQSDFLDAAFHILSEDVDPSKGNPLSYLKSNLEFRVYDEVRRKNGRYAFEQLRQLERAQTLLSSERGMPIALDDPEVLKRTSISRARAEDIFKHHSLKRPDHYEEEINERRTTQSDQLSYEEREAFHAQIQHLPERSRVVLELYYLHDITQSEIATLIDLTESRVSQIMSKALNLVPMPDQFPPTKRYSSGFFRLLKKLEEDPSSTISPEELTTLCDGPAFISNMFASRKQSLLTIRRSLLQEASVGRTAQGVKSTREALGAYFAELEQTGAPLRKSHADIGLHSLNRELPLTIIRDALAEEGLIIPTRRESRGFIRLLKDYHDTGDLPADSSMLNRYIDSPDFFAGFFSHASASIEPLKRDLFEKDAGVDFQKLTPLSLKHFQTYVQQHHPAGKEAHRNFGLVRALGMSPRSVSMPLLQARLQELGVYDKKGLLSKGFRHLISDLQEGKQIEPSLLALEPYITEPQFFVNFLSKSGAAVREFRKALFKNHPNGLPIAALSNSTQEHFRNFVRERYPEGKGLTLAKGLWHALGNKSHSVASLVLRKQLENLDVYPKQEILSQGFEDLLAHYAAHPEMEARSSILANFIDTPAFFQEFFGARSRAIRTFKTTLYARDRGIDFLALGDSGLQTFREFVRDRWPSQSEVLRDTSIGSALGFNPKTCKVSEIRKRLVDLQVYLDS